MANVDDTNDPRGRLIAARKVQDASVYNGALEKLGTLEDVMIDKASASPRASIMVVEVVGATGKCTHLPVPR